MDLFARSSYKHSNLRDTKRNFSIEETSWVILPSIQTLIDEPKPVVSEKDELE